MKKRNRVGPVEWNPSPEEKADMNRMAKLFFLIAILIAFLYPLFVT